MQYELNPADVIKEEDYEESLGEMSYRKSSRLALMITQSKSGDINKEGETGVTNRSNDIANILIKDKDFDKKQEEKKLDKKPPVNHTGPITK